MKHWFTSLSLQSGSLISPLCIQSSWFSPELGQNSCSIVGPSSLPLLFSSHSGSSRFYSMIHQATETMVCVCVSAIPHSVDWGWAHRREAAQMQTHLVQFPYLKSWLSLITFNLQCFQILEVEVLISLSLFFWKNDWNGSELFA